MLELAFFIGPPPPWLGNVDSRWTLIVVYNMLMAIIVTIPMLATVAKTDDWVFYVSVLALDFAIMSAVSIYDLVLLRRLWDQVAAVEVVRRRSARSAPRCPEREQLLNIKTFHSVALLWYPTSIIPIHSEVTTERSTSLRTQADTYL